MLTRADTCGQRGEGGISVATLWGHMGMCAVCGDVCFRMPAVGTAGRWGFDMTSIFFDQLVDPEFNSRIAAHFANQVCELRAHVPTCPRSHVPTCPRAHVPTCPRAYVPSTLLRATRCTVRHRSGPLGPARLHRVAQRVIYTNS